MAFCSCAPPVLLIALVACGSSQHAAAGADRYVLTAQRIYTTPEAAPIDNGWVEVSGGTIVAVGSGAPPEARHDAACSGGVITAGFHNSHVHFTAPAFAGAARAPAGALEPAIAELTTKWGFTTVTDTASNPGDTVPLRDRILRGELRGPKILTVGAGLYADIPFYLRELPPAVLASLPQPKTADEARAVVRAMLALGTDGTKLFIATPQGHGVIHRMAPEVAAAAVEETHRAGKLVMVHPTDTEGVTAAVTAGVDIVVHTTIDPDPSIWSPELIAQLVTKHVALVPTLKLWTYELAKRQAPKDEVDKVEGYALHQLAAFLTAGGRVLFGTDAGYMTDLDPTDEYAWMARAGMTPMQILASLTTNPAAEWNATATRGRVAEKLAADLVVLDGDPATDVKRFAAVKCTIRAGTPVYRRDAAR